MKKKEKKTEVELIPSQEELDVFSALLDENNNSNIFLYDEKNEKVEFEQIAIIPLDNKVYAILKPVTKIEGVEDDQAIVFKLTNEDDSEDLVVETDDKVIDDVFNVYYDLLKQEESK